MKKLKKHLKELNDLINENNYNLAVDYLNEFEKTEKGYSNYIKGMIFLDKNNPNNSKDKAKSCFIKSCESENAVEGAFIQLFNLVYLNEINYAKKILRRGIEKFPSSINIYEALAHISWGTEKEDLFEEIKNKKIMSIGLCLEELNYKIFNKQYSEAIKIIEKINIGKEYIFEKMKLKLVKAFSYYECSENNEAKVLFEKLITEDIGNRLDFLQYYRLISCLIGKDNVEALKVLRQITGYSCTFPPYSQELNYKNTRVFFYFEEYVLKAVTSLEKLTKDRKVLGIIRGIRGSINSQFKDNMKVIKDLKYAVKFAPRILSFSVKLSEILDSKEKYYEAYHYLISYIENNLFKENIKDIEFDFLIHCDEESVKRIANDLVIKLYRGLSSIKNKVVENLFCPLIEALYGYSEFSIISKLADHINEVMLKNLNAIFNVAYSYHTEKNYEKAIIFYKKYLEIDKDHNASLNNLGLIYKEMGKWREAFTLFERGINLYPDDKNIQNNFKDIKEAINQIKDFENENIFIKNKLLTFSKNKDENGYIICSYKLLSKYFNSSEIKADILLKHFLKKSYIIKITEHNLDTQSSVYKINPFLEENIVNFQEKCLKEKKYLEIVQRIDIDYIESLGLNAELIKKLRKVSNNDLRKIVKRDISENVFAIITESYKASLVLSGSIIETLLLYKITDKGIKKYKLPNMNKNKQIINMGLSELLEVAKTENLIESQTYHISHFIRNYRNLIHPGVEQRKKAIEASKRNALRAWEFLIDIIKEILT